MKFFKLIILSLIATTLLGNEISGTLENGLRVLNVTDSLDYKVFRGDYLKFDSESEIILEIPELDFKETLPNSDIPYIKMKKIGSFPIIVNGKKGSIEVLNYTSPSYREITSEEAIELINNVSPLILDVRTPGEYQLGHIENSSLIPVQVLRSNLHIIEDYKDEPIFIYCRSGNRSTVAAQILIENGFNNIYNLRYGINEWLQKNYKISN